MMTFLGRLKLRSKLALLLGLSALALVAIASRVGRMSPQMTGASGRDAPGSIPRRRSVIEGYVVVS